MQKTLVIELAIEKGVRFLQGTHIMHDQDPETQKEKKKVQRRTEEELDKRFNCPYANCKK